MGKWEARIFIFVAFVIMAIGLIALAAESGAFR